MLPIIEPQPVVVIGQRLASNARVAHMCMRLTDIRAIDPQAAANLLQVFVHVEV